MKEELMKRLRDFYAKEENAALVGVPASDEQIAEAEKGLNVTFHADYVEFIKAFGGAFAGISIHAFSNGSVMGKETVVEWTEEFRRQLAETSLKEQLEDGYVISMDGSGNPVMIHSTGEVLICYLDSGETEVLAGSFAELIEDQFHEW